MYKARLAHAATPANKSALYDPGMSKSTRAGVDPQIFDRFASDYDRFCGLQEVSDWPWMEAAGVRGGSRALDVGCGAGRRTLELADHYDVVVGLDLSRPLVELASERRSAPTVRYLCCDLLDYNDSDGFDLVYSHTTLHHVADLSASLQHLRTLVAPGGSAVLVDCVAPRPTPPAWVYRVGALQALPSDVRQHGWRDAEWLLKFKWAGPWLDHLTTDTYLSASEFRDQYGAVFPSGSFVDIGLLAIVWQRDMDERRCRSSATARS